MRLEEALKRSLIESRFIEPMPILEDGEAPRWRFSYDNFKNDPRPDILLLGGYTHPRTGNNLVGGINLHYLNKDQVDELARVLPTIMTGNNLKSRVRQLRNVVPQIFNYYRTYNAAYIRGVNKDVMYPKLGMVKAAKNWLSKTFGGIFKSKAQRSQDAQPKYPEDLSAMNDRLDQVVRQLQTEPPREEPSDSPEMVAARDEYIKSQQPQTDVDVKRKENIELNRATQDAEETLDQEKLKPRAPAVTDTLAQVRTKATPTIQSQPKPSTKTTPTTPPARPVTAAQQADQAQPIPRAIDEPTATTSAPTPKIIRPSQRPEDDSPEEAVPELRDISDANVEDELEESIVYYSPRLRKYVIESLLR
jgi:hypothetical protein